MTRNILRSVYNFIMSEAIVKRVEYTNHISDHDVKLADLVE